MIVINQHFRGQLDVVVNAIEKVVDFIHSPQALFESTTTILVDNVNAVGGGGGGGEMAHILNREFIIVAEDNVALLA